MSYVKSHSGHEFPKDPRTLLLKNAQAINRIFYPSTLEEIVENLRREDTPFARQCLEKMEGNSTLSMKLALKMIRQARNLDFKGCLTNEINVALNKILDEEFDKGVS
jgi:Enoyl-CoA hydratase/isomerase